jgi:hypothetical protein
VAKQINDVYKEFAKGIEIKPSSSPKSQNPTKPALQYSVKPEKQKTRKEVSQVSINPESQKTRNTEKIKTTYIIDKDLAKQIKRLALEQDKNISEIAEELLRRGLNTNLSS